jgi:hypothetical protein
VKEEGWRLKVKKQSPCVLCCYQTSDTERTAHLRDLSVEDLEARRSWRTCPFVAARSSPSSRIPYPVWLFDDEDCFC